MPKPHLDDLTDSQLELLKAIHHAGDSGYLSNNREARSLGVCPSIAFRLRLSNNPQSLPAILSGRLRGWHEQDVSRLVQ
jgi:hypothetical protein